MAETYYSLLGVAETATAAEIKTAYLRLIREVHPDRIANAPAYWQRQAGEKCKEINEAYAVLSSDEKRRLYDTQLASCRGYQATAGGTAAEPSDPPPPSSTQQREAEPSAPPQNDPRSSPRQTQDSDSLNVLAPGLLIAMVFIIMALGSAAVFGPKGATSQQSVGNTSASQGPEVAPMNSWHYTKSIDEMTGNVISQTACLFSENKLNGDEKLPPGELCSYTGWRYPAVFKLGATIYAQDTDYSLFVPGVPGMDEVLERGRCAIRMRVDDKPVFEVCGSYDAPASEINLYDSPYANHRPIMTVLKTAKIIKIELKAKRPDLHETQIFTFKTDKPLDSKW